ncbi:four helix bundle protein, partial [Planctomycetota bacterium]
DKNVTEIKQFEDLPVWQAGRELVKYIYQLTRKMPFKNDFGLCGQIQRSAVSVTSNIAEGFERGSKGEFIQFLYIARGSAGEVRSQLYNALDVRHINQSEFQRGTTFCLNVSRQIALFVNYLKGSNFKGDKSRKPRNLKS